MNGFWPSIVALGSAIVGLAVVAVVLSNRSNTVQLTGTAFQGFGNTIQAAVNPYSAGGSNQFGDGLGVTLGQFLGTSHM